MIISFLTPPTCQSKDVLSRIFLAEILKTMQVSANFMNNAFNRRIFLKHTPLLAAAFAAGAKSSARAAEPRLEKVIFNVRRFTTKAVT